MGERERYLMTSCSCCGAKQIEGAKFCSVCGKPITLHSGTTGSSSAYQRVFYDGAVHKCPNCGEVVDSFSAFCRSCGFELRGTRSTASVKSFSKKYGTLKSNDAKIDLIKTFAIPNTKEDILEFVILAASNIDERAYTLDSNDPKADSTRAVIDAWYVKLEHAYHKAGLVLHDDPDFENIEKIYFEKKQSLARAQKKVTRTKRRLTSKSVIHGRNIDWKSVVVAVMLLALMMVVPFIPSISDSFKERALEKQIEEIEELISDGDYDKALQKAELLNYSGWSSEGEERWNNVRESLMIRIKELQGEAEGKAKIPSGDFEGKAYGDVVTLFKESGFTNVKTEKVHDLITGWINNKGEVIEVVIGGSTTYDPGTYIDKDTPIIIRYHVYKFWD